MKSRFGAALEPFTLIKLAFHEKEHRELVTISSTEILKSNFDLAVQTEAAEALAYMGELVSEFAPPHEANEKLFRMLTACVDALSNAPETAPLVLRYFEAWLLRLAGLFPELRVCAECGVSFSDADIAHVDIEGRPHCQRCNRGAGTALLPETRRTLLATQRLSPPQFAKSFNQLSGEPEAQLAEFTHRLIVRTLERRPRTLVASTRAPHVASQP